MSWRAIRVRERRTCRCAGKRDRMNRRWSTASPRRWKRRKFSRVNERTAKQHTPHARASGDGKPTHVLHMPKRREIYKFRRSSIGEAGERAGSMTARLNRRKFTRFDERLSGEHASEQAAGSDQLIQLTIVFAACNGE